MADRVRCTGKQVLLDDEHLADACSEEAAEVIRDALNYSGASAGDWPSDAYERICKLFQ